MSETHFIKEAYRGCRLTVALPVAATIVLTVTFVQLPGNNLLWNELQNTGHTLLFGLLALVTLCLIRATPAGARLSPPADYLSTGLACLAIGIAIEFVQMFSGRDYSLSDVMRDLCGIIIALGIFAVFDPRLAPLWSRQDVGFRRATLAIACCLLAACLFPLAQLAYAYQLRQQAFPVIIDFTAHWSKPFLQLQHASVEQAGLTEGQTAAHGQQGARLVFHPGRYPGINIIEPYPDWSAYHYLSFDLYSNRAEPFHLVLRVHDHQHNNAHSDRFNQRLKILPGENHFRIPLQNIQTAPARRDMDLSHISGVIVFAIDIAAPVDFHASVLRLE